MGKIAEMSAALRIVCLSEKEFAFAIGKISTHPPKPET
jgi:hypothetical protein